MCVDEDSPPNLKNTSGLRGKSELKQVSQLRDNCGESIVG